MCCWILFSGVFLKIIVSKFICEIGLKFLFVHLCWIWVSILCILSYENKKHERWSQTRQVRTPALLPVTGWPGANSLASLCLGFLDCKMRGLIDQFLRDISNSPSMIIYLSISPGNSVNSRFINFRLLGRCQFRIIIAFGALLFISLCKVLLYLY